MFQYSCLSRSTVPEEVTDPNQDDNVHSRSWWVNRLSEMEVLMLINTLYRWRRPSRGPCAATGRFDLMFQTSDEDAQLSNPAFLRVRRYHSS